MSKKYFIPNDCDSAPEVTCHILCAIQKMSRVKYRQSWLRNKSDLGTIHKEDEGEEEEEEEKEEKEKKERRTRRK